MVLEIETGIIHESVEVKANDTILNEFMFANWFGNNMECLDSVCLVEDLLKEKKSDFDDTILSNKDFLFAKCESHNFIRFYRSGILPILQVSTEGFQTNFMSENNSGNYVFGSCDIIEQEIHINVSVGSSMAKFSSALKMSDLLSTMNTALKSIDDTLSSLNKRWKESSRIIPAKLALLKSLLEGYQYEGDIFDFFASVCMCGLWHPAAQTTFTQHWNEQGLARLRSSIDSTTKFIIRAIQFKLLPAAINVSNQLR